MKNSTLLLVLMIMPVSDSIADRGITRCTPLDIRTWYPARTPLAANTGSDQTPAQTTVDVAATSNVRPLSSSRTRAPTTRAPSRSSETALARVSTVAPCRTAVRATVTVYRASSTWAS